MQQHVREFRRVKFCNARSCRDDRGYAAADCLMDIQTKRFVVCWTDQQV